MSDTAFYQLLFIIGILGSAMSYFIYPVILILLKSFKNDRTDQRLANSDEVPFITFIITAFNEEKLIADKINNTLAVDYPDDKLEILVASDGSTDGTNSIVEQFHDKNVKLIHVAERKGKENAQLSAIRAAKGELLVFSDVSTRIEVHALQVIAEKFSDPQIGAVSSEDRFISQDGKIAGEGAYVKYEMWLRQLEGQINSLVGLSGSFFAARKSICHEWDIHVPSDFNTALNCIRNGKIAVSEPKLLGFYPNLKDETKEYQRKVRTVIRGIAALFNKSEVMNPFKYGLFAFQIISHKLMRWLVPWFLVITLISTVLLLAHHWFYQLALLAQLAFYLLAMTGWLSALSREQALVKIPYFFMQVNIAIAHASLQFIGGKRVTQWTPSKR